MNPTFLIGDLHIGHIWSGLDRTQENFELLKYIKDSITSVCSDKKYKKCNLIFLGDIFDNPTVSHHTITKFMDYINSYYLTSIDFDIYILCGNHDGNIESKRGSPLLEVKAGSPNLSFIAIPTIVDNILFLPYTTQETINKFIENNSLNDVEFVCTHLDIPNINYGNQDIIGLQSFIPEKVVNLNKPIFAGHIHTPQIINNINIIGSSIQTSISDGVDNHFALYENNNISYCSIPCKKIKHFEINYSTDTGKGLYKAFLDNSHILLNSSQILSIRLLCPHNLAHEIDVVKLQDTIRKHVYYLRFSFDVIKEKSFRMKELDNKMSDYDIINKFLENQDISGKDLILSDVKTLMGEC